MVKKKTRNSFEQKLEKQLTKAKVSFSYETEKISYTIFGNYIPDFIIETKSGKIYVEAKGYFRREAKAKMVAVKKQHPEMDIRFVFYKSNKAYAKWATKNKFLFAFEEIPKEWLGI